ncbi:LamG domain-containing protein [Actinomadura alba]|uniref:LamG domain-containing protein n=1 Tax=Actinomadura alba TaxID=406431 RepID=A0ABR7LJ77_9ACTN|nr:LamG domain-containing protein [Actinomadura alba]MBC6464805.1 LamG domain-containing protein [Actinomadura alba]
MSSTDYPDDGQWRDGVGRYGDFVIDDPDDQAVRYELRHNNEPLITLETKAGKPVTVSLLPRRAGPNLLRVQSVNGEGTWSAPTTYDFSVKAGTTSKAHWKLDEAADATVLQAVTRENEAEISAQPHGGVTLGVEGQRGTAMGLDGVTGYAATSGPIVDNRKSYSISAWAQPATTADGVLVSQSDDDVTGFGLSASAGHWVFDTRSSDDAAPARAVSDAQVQVGEWSHIVGVYDATAQDLTVYVNGIRAGEVSFEKSALNAYGPLRIGAGFSDGEPTDLFRGQIDDVQVFDRILVPDEVRQLSDRPVVRKGRWKLNTDGSDDTGHGNHLTLHGGAVIDPDSGFFYGMSPAGLLLNGTDGHAETAAPAVRTDQSFTIAGWVNPPSRPTQAATVFSQAGTAINRFALRYVPGEDPAVQGEWRLEMADEDSASSRTTAVRHPQFNEGSWEHLALVYDAAGDTMSLYVNGRPYADESAKAGVFGFNASNGGLQVGRSKLGDPEYWPGAIDDVWAYQGALSQEQIAILAVPSELETQEGP